MATDGAAGLDGLAREVMALLRCAYGLGWAASMDEASAAVLAAEAPHTMQPRGRQPAGVDAATAAPGHWPRDASGPRRCAAPDRGRSRRRDQGRRGSRRGP